MNIVDSSGWLEYFADGKNAAFFEKPLNRPSELIVPSITIYEVFKVVKRERGENEALQVIAVMEQGEIADLDAGTALSAARISSERKLPMADSIIMATANKYKAVIWSQDADFKNEKGVQYISKK